MRLDLGVNYETYYNAIPVTITAKGSTNIQRLVLCWRLRKSTKSVLETIAFEGYFGGFSEDGQRLVISSSSDGRTRLYDLSGQELASFEGYFGGFSEDGQQFAVYSPKRQISRFYDLSGQPTELEPRVISVNFLLTNSIS